MLNMKCNYHIGSNQHNLNYLANSKKGRIKIKSKDRYSANEIIKILKQTKC